MAWGRRAPGRGHKPVDAGLAVASREVRHRPVLLDAAVEALGLHPGGAWLDATLGEGGHSRAMLATAMSGS